MPTVAARIAFIAGLVAGYALLAVVHTWPLARHLDTHLAGQGLGDNASFLWNAWWMRVALATPQTFFWNPLIEAPIGSSLALHTHSALSAFLAATVLGPLPLVRAHNLVLIASLALNGLAAYTLTVTVTRARAASALAGALFVVAPPVAARLMGHYNLVVVWPLVFAIAACVAWWQRPTVVRACLFAVAAATVPYADYYYAVFLALFALLYGALELWTFGLDVRPRDARRGGRVLLGLAAALFVAGAAIAVLPPFQLDLGLTTIRVRSAANALTAAWILAIVGLIVRWRPWPRATWRARMPLATTWPSVLPAAVLFVALVSPLLIAGWQVWAAGDYVTQGSSLKSSPRGIDVASLVMGPPFSGVLGPAVRRGYAAAGLDVMEASGWIGVVPMALLVLAALRARDVPDARRWLVVAAAFAIWALGPYLTVLGRNLGLILPQALAHVVPIVNNARIPGRAMVVVHLAVLVAIAAACASRRVGWSGWGLAGMGALAIAESAAAPLPLVALDPPGVYADLAARPAGGAVLTIPFGVRDGFGEKGLVMHDALIGQTVHGRPLAGGFLARLSPRVWSWYDTHEPYRTLLLASTPGATPPPVPACDAIMAGLRAADVRFVVLYPDASPALRSLAEAALPLTRIADDGRRVLFEVDPARPCARP